jgi:hypothetical protein
MHEWTYEAMVYDLLPVEGNVIRCVGGFSHLQKGLGRRGEAARPAGWGRGLTSQQEPRAAWLGGLLGRGGAAERTGWGVGPCERAV